MQPHDTLMPGRVQRICEHCQGAFNAKRDQINRGWGRFCSRDCQNAWQRRSIEDHFWPFVDRTTTPDGCWLWIGSRTKFGYGHAKLPNGPKVHASRLSWELHFGTVPDGLWVLHNCPTGDNPACVNPAHLWLGTRQQNMADMVAKGRSAHRFGSESSHPVLQEQDVVAIRAEYQAGGISQRALAKKFGISQRHVCDLVRGKRWAHIPITGAAEYE